MSSVAAFWTVVAIAVVGGAVVLALIGLSVLAQRRRDAALIEALRADVLPWAQRGGWVEADPPRELTAGGLGEVLPGERRCCSLVGEYAGHRIAVFWCVRENEDGTWRYTTILVGLAEPVPATQIYYRDRRLSLRRRRPPGQGPEVDAWFAQNLKISSDAHLDAVQRLATSPVRRALRGLYEVGILAERAIWLERRAMRVVVSGWPRPAALSAQLDATTDLAVALSVTGADDPAQPDT